jgi:hypothetical protein
LKYVNDHRGNGLRVFNSPSSDRRDSGGGYLGGSGTASSSSSSSLLLPEPFLLYASEVKLMSLGGVRLGGGDPVNA